MGSDVPKKILWRLAMLPASLAVGLVLAVALQALGAMAL